MGNPYVTAKDTIERLCEGIRRAERELWPDILRKYGRRAGKRYSQMHERLVLAGATEADLDEIDRLARETPIDWYEVAERALYAMSLRQVSLAEESKRAAFARARGGKTQTLGEVVARSIDESFLRNERVLPAPPIRPHAPRGLAALGCGLASNPLEMEP